MKKILILILLALVLSSCSGLSFTQEVSNNADITFTVSSFELKYEKTNTGTFSDETYDGNGIISASGDQNLIKKPYLVLLKVNKISGGDKRNGNYVTNVVVNNGIGKFKTNDWSYEENSKLEKPVYEFNILGYIPYELIEQATDD